VRRAGVAVCPVGIAVGLAAELRAFELDQPLLWLPDLAVGVALIVAGSAVMARATGAGLLLAAAGFAWFAGTIAPEATYWHRGLLVHLIVSYPGARPASRTGWLVVAIGYLLAVVSPLWRNESSAVVLAAAALCLCVAGLRSASVRRRRSRLIACGVGAVLAAVLMAGAITRLAATAGSAALPSLLVYEAALVIAAGCVAFGLRPARRAAVTDLVIELGENRSDMLRDALADVLGDPTVRLGYWNASQARYVDIIGRTLAAPARGEHRVMTRIDRAGRPFAAMVHDSALAADTTFADALAAADRLRSANTALQAEIQARVDDVSASRHRLQIAVDEERRRLERRLAAAPESRLVATLSVLRRMSSRSDPHLDRAVDQLERALVELRDAASGLYPRELAGGLAIGLAALRDRCPIPVELSVTAQRFDAQVEVAAYYLCAEALTNVTKHAQATGVCVHVADVARVLTITVTDDGVGGATLAGGTGLLGLVDRVESIGGRLAITAEPVAGTRLTAEIPLDGQPGLGG